MLIEMPIEGPFPEYVEFFNEMGQLIRQPIQFEWIPSKCSHYNMLGHTSEVCKKKKNSHMEWRSVSKTLVSNEESNAQSLIPELEVMPFAPQTQSLAPSQVTKETQPESLPTSSSTSPTNRDHRKQAPSPSSTPTEAHIIHHNPFQILGRDAEEEAPGDLNG